MNKLFLLFLFTLLTIACGRQTNAPRQDLDFFPAHCVALIRINNLTAFKSDLKNNHLLRTLKESSLFNDVQKKLEALSYLQSNSLAILAFYAGPDDSLEFLLSSPQGPELLIPEEITNLSRETYTHMDRTMEKYTVEGKHFFSTEVDSQFLMSSSDSLLRVAANIPVGMERAPFSTLYASANPERNANLFLDLKKAAGTFPGLLLPDPRQALPRFSDWISLDMDSQQDFLSFSGITMPPDSMPSFVTLFENANPLPLTTPSFAPETSLAIIAYALEDYRAFASAREAFTGQEAIQDSLFHTVEEVGVILDRSGKVVLLNTYGSEQLSRYLNNRSNGSFSYKGHDIHTFDKDSILSDQFYPLVTEFRANYYTILENALLFSNSRESLLNLIDHYGLAATFDKTSIFMSAKESLADQANILLVAGEEGIEQLMGEVLPEDHFADLKKADLSNYAIAAQLVSEGSFSHITLLLKRTDTGLDKRPAVPWYTVQLDAPIATDPQFVINHRTHQKEIVVQDEDNQLYLIGTKGKVLWKKALGGRIQGPITQVDLYKNGRLQMAFTTDNQFLVLDRNGKEVGPFTLKYKGGNLNPLAVFDYEQNRNYRFVVSQGNKVYMYDRLGKIVSGFTYTESQSPILPSPQHIRLGSRDYLLFRLEDGSLKILNRTGKTRIKVSEPIDFSGNGVYAYNNQFALTDKKGTLFMINEKGKIAKTALGLHRDHGFETTSKSMVYLNDNILNIKGKEVKLDYGVYTSPRIFYIYDKIYVSVTDTQSQRSYLFDSQAKPIPGFPVPGSSSADLADMDNDRSLELVTRQHDQTLIVYRLN